MPSPAVSRRTPGCGRCSSTTWTSLLPSRGSTITCSQSAATRPGSFPEDFRARRSPTFTLLADAIADGIEQDLFRDDDIWESSLMIAAFLHGLIQLYHGERIGMSDPDFRALCLSLGERMIDGLRN
jgi:hypothetical protein